MNDIQGFLAQILRREIGNDGNFEDAHHVLHYLGRKVADLVETLSLGSNLVDVALNTTPEASEGRVEIEHACDGSTTQQLTLLAKNATQALAITFEIVSVETVQDNAAEAGAVPITEVELCDEPFDIRDSSHGSADTHDDVEAPAKFEYEMEENRA